MKSHPVALNSVLPSVIFLYKIWKHKKTLWLTDVLKGYKNAAFSWIETALTYQKQANNNNNIKKADPLLRV